MSNNIRTISQLEDLNNGNFTFADLSSTSLFIEVSKNNTNGTVQTYKLSMAEFLGLLIGQIHNIGDNEWWVTIGSEQTITGEKTFNSGVNFGNNTNISSDGTISSTKIIEGTARKAYWA